MNRLAAQDIRIEGISFHAKLKSQNLDLIVKKDVGVFKLMKFVVSPMHSIECISSQFILSDQLRQLHREWGIDQVKEDKAFHDSIEKQLAFWQKELENSIFSVFGIQEALNLYIISRSTFNDRDYIIYQYSGSDAIYGGYLAFLDKKGMLLENIPLVEDQARETIGTAFLIDEHSVLVLRQGLNMIFIYLEYF